MTEQGPITEQVRVLIADDHPIVRAGVAGLLADEPGIDVVGEASHGEQAVQMTAALHPDVVLMDLRMPVMDGVAATAAILGSDAGAGTGGASRVLILTTYETDDRIVAAIEAGAAGYLLKAAPHEEIVAGIRAVAAGQSALSPQVAVRLVQRTRRPAAVTLTEREREVLQLVAQGRSNKEIAAALGIAATTVKTHLLKVFEKLGVQDRTRAVTLAMEQRLIPPPASAIQDGF